MRYIEFSDSFIPVKNKSRAIITDGLDIHNVEVQVGGQGYGLGGDMRSVTGGWGGGLQWWVGVGVWGVEVF